VNEADLHARHRWLVDHRPPKRVMTDPDVLRRADRRLVGVGAVLLDRLGLVSGRRAAREWRGRRDASRGWRKRAICRLELAVAA
jgi:hypothetical protein